MQKRNKALGIVLCALLVLLGLGSWWGRAAKEGDVGFVNMEVVGERYVQPLLDPQLQQELKKLQAEFDTKSKNLDEKARAELFEQYQVKLDTRRNELIGGYLSKITTAVSQVMKDTGLRVVIDQAVVLAGGVDITEQVLVKLKAPAPKK